MTVVKRYINDFLHLFFPHNCAGCGTGILNTEDALCAECLNKLPATGFFSTPGNPVEKIFFGRLNIQKAGSAFYFTKESVIQQVIIRLKYKNNPQAGAYLGKLLGAQLKNSARFDDVDVIIPMPLNDRKLFKRGYNQSGMLVNGIVSVWNKPVLESAVTRTLFTETQTHKNRIARWETIEGVFEVTEPNLLSNKHVLLVDDIVTTGATLEACGNAILKLPGSSLSLATLAYTV